MSDSTHEGPIPKAPAQEALAPIGAGLHYRLSGTAGDLPEIVLESGGLGAKRNWSVAEGILSQHTRVLSYDRAGVGASPAAEEGVGGAAVAARLAQLVDHAGIRKPFVLAGYSLGGLYARYFAMRHPEHVAGLVLVDATPVRLAMPAPMIEKALKRLKLLHGLARLRLDRLLWLLFGRSTSYAELQSVFAEFRSPAFLVNAAAELQAITRVQDEVAREAPELRHPTLAVIAGIQPSQMTDADWRSAQEQHRALHAAAPAPLSLLIVNAMAHHGTVVNHPEHGRALAAQILEFAQMLKR